MIGFPMKQFFCWDLSTGAQFIGSLGVLKHSLAILLIYLESIAFYVFSKDDDSKDLSAVILITMAILLIIALVINLINIILSYRLYKIKDTNKIQDLTNWINAERIYLVLFIIYVFIKINTSNPEMKTILRILTFVFDFYCYMCVAALREEYYQRASLLTPLQP